jgi:hypothetical protein
MADDGQAELDLELLVQSAKVLLKHLNVILQHPDR